MAEIQNLDLVGELLDYGVNLNGKVPSLWAIIRAKDGVPLQQLRGFKDAIRKGTVECGNYMKLVRHTIVQASKPYFSLPGAPGHGFVLPSR